MIFGLVKSYLLPINIECKSMLAVHIKACWSSSTYNREQRPCYQLAAIIHTFSGHVANVLKKHSVQPGRNGVFEVCLFLCFCLQNSLSELKRERGRGRESERERQADRQTGVCVWLCKGQSSQISTYVDNLLMRPPPLNSAVEVLHALTIHRVAVSLVVPRCCILKNHLTSQPLSLLKWWDVAEVEKLMSCSQ